MLSRGLFQRPCLVNGWQATAWRDERSEPPEVLPPPGRVQGRHKHHHDYLRSKLSGRGHGIFCNWLIIKYHFNSSVETQAFFGHVSTSSFITHWKSTLPKTKRGRVPPPNFNVMRCAPARHGTTLKTLTSRAQKGRIYSRHDHFQLDVRKKRFNTHRGGQIAWKWPAAKTMWQRSPGGAHANNTYLSMDLTISREITILYCGARQIKIIN